MFSSCTTYMVSQTANKEHYNKKGEMTKPYVACKALYLVTVPFDLVTSPFKRSGSVVNLNRIKFDRHLYFK